MSARPARLLAGLAVLGVLSDLACSFQNSSYFEGGSGGEHA